MTHHSAGHVITGGHKITLSKAVGDYAHFKRESLARRAYDPELAETLEAAALALAAAHDECVEYRRAAGWRDPYAADRAVNQETAG